MTATYRLALLATSISAAIALSGCQPASEDTKETPVTEVAPPVAVPLSDPAIEDEVRATHEEESSVSMTDILKGYTKAMTDMHAEMMVGLGYNDPDTAFAKIMLGHHRGAMDMAKIELKYGNDPDMRELAQQIMDAQQLEIDTLKKWLASHPDIADPKPNTQAMQQAYTENIEVMHNKMLADIADPIPDMAFARSMLSYYIGAVDMAMVQLKYGTDDEMRKLAQQIMATQQPEFKFIQEWIAIYNKSDEFLQDEQEIKEEQQAESKAQHPANKAS